MATNSSIGPLEIQQAPLRNSIVAFLKSNESSLRSFILTKQPPSTGQIKEKGPIFSKIGTYTPMDEAVPVPSSSIAMFCTRIDRPLEYAIEKNKYTDLYGVFIPNANDASQFVMETYSVVGSEQKPVQPMLMDMYRWEPVQKKMVSVRVEVLVALTMVSPIIREKCEILQRDFESILEEDKRSIKTLLKYVDILYEAMLKHLNTNLDKDVFYTVISRRKFADVERHLRKYLWDYSELILANLVSIIRKNRTDLQDLQASSEGSAFESTLNILIAFLNEMHPLILKNIRLDPQHVKEDIRVYLNTLIKAYIPTTSSSDPLSDHFIFLTDSSMCRPESKEPPTTLELLDNLFVDPAFLEGQKKVSAFVKDMPIESRTSIQNGLKELMSKIYDTNMALTRSVRFLTVMVEKPDAAVSDIMKAAMKTDDIGGLVFFDFSSIRGPTEDIQRTKHTTVAPKPDERKAATENEKTDALKVNNKEGPKTSEVNTSRDENKDEAQANDEEKDGDKDENAKLNKEQTAKNNDKQTKKNPKNGTDMETSKLIDTGVNEEGAISEISEAIDKDTDKLPVTAELATDNSSKLDLERSLQDIVDKAVQTTKNNVVLATSNAKKASIAFSNASRETKQAADEAKRIADAFEITAKQSRTDTQKTAAELLLRLKAMSKMQIDLASAQSNHKVAEKKSKTLEEGVKKLEIQIAGLTERQNLAAKQMLVAHELRNSARNELRQLQGEQSFEPEAKDTVKNFSERMKKADEELKKAEEALKKAGNEKTSVSSDLILQKSQLEVAKENERESLEAVKKSSENVKTLIAKNKQTQQELTAMAESIQELQERSINAAIRYQTDSVNLEKTIAEEALNKTEALWKEALKAEQNADEDVVRARDVADDDHAKLMKSKSLEAAKKTGISRLLAEKGLKGARAATLAEIAAQDKLKSATIRVKRLQYDLDMAKKRVHLIGVKQISNDEALEAVANKISLQQPNLPDDLQKHSTGTFETDFTSPTTSPTTADKNLIDEAKDVETEKPSLVLKDSDSGYSSSDDESDSVQWKALPTNPNQLVM